MPHPPIQGSLSTPAEYSLLLDSIVPLVHARADYRDWDPRQWGQTLRIADWHRVSPILFCHLEQRGGAPPAVRSALERTYLASAARSLFIAAARRRIVDALLAAGSPAMLLKGAALVDTVYKDPAQREMLDLDILVPADRVSAATAALAPLGYRAVASPHDPTRPSVELHHDHHHGPALVGEHQVVAVELHHHIALADEGSRLAGERSRFDLGGMWERARPAASGAHMLPSPEDLLVHVCLHFTRNRLGGSYRRRHTGGALAQIGDIARVVEREPVDWDLLVAIARDYGLDTGVFVGLFAARELGVQIPDTAVTALRPAGFDDHLGRRLVALRVLRDGDHLPTRTLRWMFAPSRDVLSRGWNADPTATVSLARAYMRRARAHVPLARSTLRRPWQYVQDQRLNGQIRALEERRA